MAITEWQRDYGLRDGPEIEAAKAALDAFPALLAAAELALAAGYGGECSDDCFESDCVCGFQEIAAAIALARGEDS